MFPKLDFWRISLFLPTFITQEHKNFFLNFLHLFFIRNKDIFQTEKQSINDFLHTYTHMYTQFLPSKNTTFIFYHWLILIAKWGYS